MDRTCKDFREQLPEGRGDGAAPAPEDHAARCPDCARWLARAAHRSERLRDLPRQDVPDGLAGAVAAALEADFRRARAVRALSLLRRTGVPPAVEGGLAEAAEGAIADAGGGAGLDLGRRLRSPGVLERLVAEEIADPSKARARRFVSSLPRRAAPAVLAARLAGSREGAPAVGPAGFRGRRASRLLALASLAASLALVFTLVRTRSAQEPTRQWTLRVERIDSAASLDPMARGLVDAVSGGILAAEGVAR